MIVNYFELTADFNLKPAQALEYFRDKGLAPTFSYLDMVGEEHDLAFTVAKMMDTDLLATVRKKLDQALDEGKTLQEFQRELIPTLQAAGWWGKKDVVDPLTGRVIEAQLGSPSRLETIFRTNLQSAYAAGHWETIHQQADNAAYLLYDAVDDHRTRPEHAALDGTVLPVGSPFWDTHYPPNDYGCRCGVIQLDENELADYGLTVSAPPAIPTTSWTNPRTGATYAVPARGVSPNFAHNPGKARMAKIEALAAEKALALAAEEAAALAAAQGKLEQAKTASRIQAQADKALKELQKAETVGTFEKQHQKATQRAAQWQIDEAVATKAPYLSTALKAVAKTKAGQAMTPAELLDSAKAKAAATKQADHVNKYKKAKIAGKQPPAAVQQTFDSLDPEQQAMIAQEIDVKTGNYQAQLQIDEYLTAKGYSYEKKAAKKLENQGSLEGLDAKGKLAAIQEAAAAQKLKDQQAKAVKAYQANVIAGKKPTDNQTAAFKALPEEQQVKIANDIDAEIAKAKPKADEVAPASAPKMTDTEGPVMDSLSQTGPQKGSNPGGKYLDTTTGQEWYIKTPDSLDNAKNEVLAGKLYQLAGVEVPDLAIVDYNGRPGIASKIIDGLNPDAAGLRNGTISNVGEHFAVDAWLANWDVVGLSYDNLLVKANRAIRVDTGGALRYRAQGTLKGTAWGNTVGELDTLRDAGLNPQAASVFANVTDEQIRSGVTRIARITDDQIDALVTQYGPAAAAERNALAATLKARRDDLVSRYGVTQAQAQADLPAGVTKGEAERIGRARQNGYSVPADKDQIEDQQILFWHEAAADGTKRTHAQLKVRGAGLEAMQKLIGPAGGQVDLRGDLDDKIITAIKGIVTAATKEGLRDKDLARIREAATQYQAVQRQIEDAIKAGTLGAKDKADYLKHYRPWIDYLQEIGQQPLGQTVTWSPEAKALPELFQAGKALIPQAQQMAFEFRQRHGKGFSLKRITRGYAQETGNELNSPDFNYFEGDIEGATVRFWGQDAPQALRGRVEIMATGTDANAASAALQALSRAGIDTARPTALDAEELYLRQIAYHRNMTDDLFIADTGASQQQRIDYLKDALSVGLAKRIDEMPGYNPTGTRQAFEEGFIHRYRPDLPEQEWSRFQRDYRLYHANTGGMAMPDLIDVILNSGGKMAPTTDKMRRGVPIGGMSPTQDLNSGGAQYFFTRLRQATQATPGFYWKAKHVARLDAISYNHDAYGRTTGDYVTTHRKSSIEEWRDTAKASSNETILKDGISLFDSLDRIVAQTQTERNAIIKVLKSHGYHQWPDGRELTEVITLK